MTYSIAGLPVKYTRGPYNVPRYRITLFFFLLFIPFLAVAQTGDDEPADEISVSLEVRNVGIIDVPAIYHNNDIYLSITNVFDFLKIRNTPTSSFDSVKGYLLNEQDVFLIDKINGRIHYHGKVVDVKTDGLIKTETSLYLNLKYLKSVFGFDGTFYFRRLVVTLSSEIELPVVREMRLEQMRRNVNRLRGDIKADTVIKRKYPLFHFGMADWAVMSSQQSQGADQTTLNLGLGAVIAGGETNASINYYSNQPFTEKLQFYQWRFVNNDNPVLRQSIAGKIFTQATSTLYAPVVGIQFTNTPTTYRKSYGTYTLSNTTEPNWIVELYVNDVLVDYKKADASGFYSFEVPLIYGYTVVKLRFYGPYGEERTSQQSINIPFNFLPKHEFEYSASAGIVEDDKYSRFSRLRMNYGVSHRITVGGGVEYLSSVASGNTMPFVNTSVRLAPRLLVSGEYTHGVRSRGLLSYRLPSSIQFDLDYTKYDKGQTAIFFNYLEERKAVISMPIHAKGISLFSRLTLDQVVVPESRYMNTEWAFTGFVGRVGLNFSTYTSFVKETLPYLYSIASVALPLPAKTIFTSQMQYDYKMGKPVFVKFSFQKYLFGKGYLELAYQEYFYVNNRNILLGLRYDFSFSRVAFSALTGNNNTYSRVEAASGSLIFDAKTKYVNANNRTNVGKGAICIQPYLDLNNNHKKDNGEPRAHGLKIRINGGRIIYDDKDTCIRILDLEPYSNYYIELNRNAFDNISWQIKNKTISVAANPNSFTVIEVPVIVAGEVSGIISLKSKNTELPKGLGQVIINIYNEDSVYVARAISESDGFFSYLGLSPGLYWAQVDTAQLHKLNLSSSPSSLPVNISGNKEGDVVDGLEFVLQSTLKETATDSETTGEPLVVADKKPADTQKQVATQKPAGSGNKVVDEKDAATEKNKQYVKPGKIAIAYSGKYAIVVEVYGEIVKAAILKAKINRYFGLPVYIVQDSIHFKVEIVGFSRRQAAAKHLPRLKEWGFPEALIIELGRETFNNVSTQVKKTITPEITDPGRTNKPSALASGEISGIVSLHGNDPYKQKGQGQISISVFNKQSKRIVRTTTESDGFFSYSGLYPGDYTVIVDIDQLHKLDLEAYPALYTINISGDKDVDIIDGLGFVLGPRSVNTVSDQDIHEVINATGKKLIDTGNRADPGQLVKQAETEKVIIGHTGSYAIVVEVYGNIDQASILKAKLIRAFKLPVSIVQDGEDFVVEIVGFSDRDAARKHLPRLKEWGFPEALIIKLKEQVLK